MVVSLRYGRLVPATLYHHGVVHSAADPFAEAVLVVDGTVAWLGPQDAVAGVRDVAQVEIDLDGALVTPAFVDARVHLTELGLTTVALDLSSAAAREQVLELVARDSGGSAPLIGLGLDESGWPDPRRPTRDELDRAGRGAAVHLGHRDGAAAVVSTALAELSGCRDLPGWHDDGWVTGPAHLRAREATRHLSTARRTELHRAALAVVAAGGIAAVHEHAGPGWDRDGLVDLLAATADPSGGLPRVLAVVDHLCRTLDDVRDVLTALPDVVGIGLTLDGGLASRTAALRQPYTDDPGRGDLLAGAEDVANHVGALTRAGRRAVLRATGDRAVDEAVLGLRVAVEVEGLAAVRAAGHRLDGAAMLDAPALAAAVLLAMGAALDLGELSRIGMAARRLGPGRSAGLHPLADLSAAGVPLAVGSGAPAAVPDPWAAVRAAIDHPDPSQRISARAAFRAHTRGGWRLAGLDGDGAGEIRVGAPAHLAVWRTGELGVQAPQRGRLAAWSSDPRSGTPVLPLLGDDHPAPVCLRTLRDGVVVHDAWT